MKFVLLLIFIFINNFSFGQKAKDYLISYTDTTTAKELIGYKDPSGNIIIKAQYTHVYTDTLYKMAIVLKDGEWIGIDRSENVILKPFIYDNGPDYLEEGLFRFVDNDKIGFATIDGEIVIAAKYDFVTPFENGVSKFTIGGYKKYDKGGEHWHWSDGYESGFVNHAGQEFWEATALKGNKREAWTKDDKHVVLNKLGQIIKQLK
ncbi:WG repeat-containing protein [Sphingobacterium sp. ML3W]|uniref:WG repeat-containing protein n=1 Tax=Sphingobacterium sp. ML3W TaxID=1538644 RepID=UPI00130E2F9D|nr:WG repeat-containing protein [Sphingobacterium sp. ML3W]